MYRFLVMNKMLSVFFFISVFTITLFEFICADQVEIFAGGAKLANVSVNLSLAYMSAFIFYIVIAYYPENSKRKHLSEPILRTKNIRSFNIQGSILFFCLSLLSIGVIVGFTIKANSTTLDALYKAFGIISGIGTLLTALIASLALYTWKYQFSHGERFKAFKKLEEIALDCISAIEVYRGVYEDEHLSGNTRCYHDDHNKAKNKSLDTFRESKERYRKDVDFVQSLLTNEELTEFEFTYGNFNSKVHGILNSVSQSYEFNGEEQHKKLLIVENDILELKLKVKEHFRQFRGR